MCYAPPSPWAACIPPERTATEEQRRQRATTQHTPEHAAMRAVPRRTEGSGTKVPRLRRNAGNAPSRCVQACSEEAKGIIFPTLHLVIIEDEAFETAVLGEDAGLRGDGLGGEDAVDGGEEGVAVEELAVAGELLDAVDAAVAFDLDGDVLTVGVEGHDVDGADGGGVFAADELGAGADAVDLLDRKSVV